MSRDRLPDTLTTAGYHKRPNDLVTAREVVQIIDHRVSVLLAHWEAERRRPWYVKAWARVRRAS